MKEPDWGQIEEDLEDWGYYRDIEPWEWGVSVWFRWGPDMIFWFNNASEPDEPKAVALHVCAAPMSHGRFGAMARRFMYGVYTIAELLEAEKLVAMVSHNDSTLRGYLERLGWSENTEGWMVMALGES